MWNHHTDPFISARTLLQSERACNRSTYIDDNLRGLTIYINSTINILSSKTKELPFDATYQTNSLGKTPSNTSPFP